MAKLKGYQKKYLKGIAHDMKPLVFIGHKGVSTRLFQAVDEALDKHELIKVKFIDFKEKNRKKDHIQICQNSYSFNLFDLSWRWRI